jgi:hypothetical protein
VAWIFLSLPHYNGPHKFVEIESQDDFYAILNDQTQQKNKMNAMIVLFYADWSDTCLYVT